MMPPFSRRSGTPGVPIDEVVKAFSYANKQARTQSDAKSRLDSLQDALIGLITFNVDPKEHSAIFRKTGVFKPL